MTDLISSARIVDLILSLMVVEGVCLVAYHRRTDRGLMPLDLLSTLLAGGFLVLALRGVLAQVWWGWIAISLSAALVAHVYDLSRRWRR